MSDPIEIICRKYRLVNLIEKLSYFTTISGFYIKKFLVLSFYDYRLYVISASSKFHVVLKG